MEIAPHAAALRMVCTVDMVYTVDMLVLVMVFKLLVDIKFYWLLLKLLSLPKLL